MARKPAVEVQPEVIFLDLTPTRVQAERIVEVYRMLYQHGIALRAASGDIGVKHQNLSSTSDQGAKP